MSTKVLKEMFEVHKPSSQITNIYENGDEVISLEPFQHDAMNYMCYKAREQIIKKENINEKIKEFESDDDLFDFLRIQQIKIDLDELSKFTGKYKSSGNRKNMSDTIKRLENIKVRVGVFKKDDLMIEDRFSLISRVKRVTNSKIITIWLEPELILGWVFDPRPFAKLYLKIQTSLSRTYSKILYEVCKDYVKLGEVTKEFNLWKSVLNLKAENVSRLKYNYLNKAVKDINQHTDIKIPGINSFKKNKKSYMTIKIVNQPKSRLESLGLIEESIDTHKHYSRSKKKLDNLIKNGYKVTDKEMWIETDIKKNQDRYDAESRIDNWWKSTPKDDRNNLFEEIADRTDHCDDPIVTIEDYKIIGLFSKDAFTSNPLETIEMINEIISE